MEDIEFSIPRYKNKSSFFSPSPRKARNVVSFRDFDKNDENSTSKTRAPSPADFPTNYGTMEQLASAIEKRDKDTVAELLSSRYRDPIDVNQVIPGCAMSLLHLSVGFSNNQTEIVELLLREGGEPNNTNIEEGLSPLHLSVMYDYDKVMVLLMNYGGDPEIQAADGQNCYDIVRKNVEEECNERCFGHFFKKSAAFRKSMGRSFLSSKSKVQLVEEEDSGTCDGFISCTSQLSGEITLQNEAACHNMARKLFPSEYSYLMTEDESGTKSSENDSSYYDDRKDKLTTIHEESGVVSVGSPLYDYTTPSPLVAPRGRGIGSITCPVFVLTDDETSTMSDPSCVNSTPPLTPQPTEEELLKLKEQMKQLRVPVTPSTYGILSKYADSESRMESLMSPKTGTCNFSSELQAGIQNFNLIHEWGKHKIDFLQNATPTTNTSKSFYNYLLLDPRVIKKVNFSGDHLKAGIINSSEKFEKFLHSIFYIGKAHGKRPLDHLVDAKTKFVEMGRKPVKAGEKIDKILDIWRSGLGVIIVSVFHHSSQREALVNEACMIDAMGLAELSNQMKGSYTGTIAGKWPQKMKNQLGCLQLYKSFCTFVVSDGKQFFPQDF